VPDLGDRESSDMGDCVVPFLALFGGFWFLGVFGVSGCGVFGGFVGRGDTCLFADFGSGDFFFAAVFGV
jgi:hypothetical protein